MEFSLADGYAVICVGLFASKLAPTGWHALRLWERACSRMAAPQNLQFFQRHVQLQHIHHRRPHQRLFDVRIEQLLQGRHRHVSRCRNTRQLIGNCGRWQVRIEAAAGGGQQRQTAPGPGRAPATCWRRRSPVWPVPDCSAPGCWRCWKRSQTRPPKDADGTTHHRRNPGRSATSRGLCRSASCTRLPLACSGKATCATPVTTSG